MIRRFKPENAIGIGLFIIPLTAVAVALGPLWGPETNSSVDAMFGLHPDKTLHAKALIYLSLSHYYLKEIQESEQYLSQALDLMAGQGFAAIDLDERARGEVTGLLARFELAQFAPPPPETKVVSKPDPNSSDPPVNPEEDDLDGNISALEDRLDTNPSNIQNYYDLHELYLQKGERREARRTLQRLVEAHPDEVYGYYLLGRMRYRDGRFKDAEEYFREALKPRPDIELDNDLMEELRAYQIIAVYQRGDKNRALDIMSVSVHIFTEAKIRQLPLSGSDKAVLREVIREYMKR
jgi:tetratricopeptide (TPR) repeat protein